MKVYFNSNFWITKISTNHPKLLAFQEKNEFPRTFYRILNKERHPSFLHLYFQLKYNKTKTSYKIHLELNNSEVIGVGKLEVLPNKNLYCLKLTLKKILNKDFILDSYQEIPTHIKEVGYKLYEEVYNMDFTQFQEISEVISKFHYSPSSLYRIFNSVIGTYPSTIWMDRRLIAFKQHLLKDQKNVSEIYWQYGFKNLRSLNRNFKKRFKITPSEFRKKYNNKLSK